MTKARLLPAVCTVAMLAAAPAWAQTSPPSGDPNAPAGQTGSSSGSTGSHAAHRSSTAHRGGATHSRTDTSQDAAVDQLNDQSYQAARQGQAYNGAAPSSGGMTAPAGPGNMK